MDRPDAQQLPLQVLFGWLPQVAVKDARLYVAGLADKHCKSIADTGYVLLPFDDGWAFEVQEGGSGQAFLPSILKAYQEARKAQVPLEEAERFVIETATRKVQVELLQEGFTTVTLPESSITPPSLSLVPSGTLNSLVPERRNVLYIGAGVFLAGILTLTVGTLWRYQPQLAPTAQTISSAKSPTPIDEWNRLVATQVTPGTMITKLEYKNGKWDIVKGPSE